MKKIILALLVIISFASCNYNNNHMRCDEQGWCGGHVENRRSQILTYCVGLPHSKSTVFYTQK